MPVPTLSDVQVLERLVAFDTTSDRSNLPLLDFVAEYAEGAGARVERFPSPDGDKANLLLTVGPPDADGGGLLLSGHTDVVPAGTGWSSSPFALSDAGDRLVGRGACDMKGFLAVALNRCVAAGARSLRRPLMLLLTYDEEVGTRGARRFSETWEAGRALPRAAVIGEPTALRVVRAHKGIVEVAVEVAGKSAHSGYPHLGRSAIEPAARITVALAGLREALARERPAGHALFPDVPFEALNVGVIAGGSAPNVVPDRCTLLLTARPLPGGDPAALVHRVEHVVREAAGDSPVTIAVRAESPPLATEASAPVVRALLEAVGQDEALAVSYATDAGWLQRLGVDCAVFGPGDIAVAHQPDEYVPTAHLEKAGTVLERLMERFCR